MIPLSGAGGPLRGISNYKAIGTREALKSESVGRPVDSSAALVCSDRWIEGGLITGQVRGRALYFPTSGQGVTDKYLNAFQSTSARQSLRISDDGR